MFQIEITLMSKSESLLGLMFDQGEYKTPEEKWINFTRVRIGIVILTIDFSWFSKN